MAEITIDNIVFNNVKNVGEIVGSAPISFDNSSSGPDTELGGIINAIDIDWNGAQIDDDVIINNTGELLNYIKGAYSSGGSSLSDGFTADEITELQELISSDSQSETTIKNINSRISDLNNRILELELFLSDNVKTKLTNLINNASKVTLITNTTNSGRYLLTIKVEPASGGGTPTSGQVVGGIEKLDGAVHAGVVTITDDLATKLDKTAINYDGSGNLTVDLD